MYGAAVVPRWVSDCAACCTGLCSLNLPPSRLRVRADWIPIVTARPPAPCTPSLSLPNKRCFAAQRTRAQRRPSLRPSNAPPPPGRTTYTGLVTTTADQRPARAQHLRRRLPNLASKLLKLLQMWGVRYPSSRKQFARRISVRCAFLRLVIGCSW